jgi:hypothetical protein
VLLRPPRGNNNNNNKNNADTEEGEREIITEPLTATQTASAAVVGSQSSFMSGDVVCWRETDRQTYWARI